jgi:pyridoxine/pyridoxamine 5'-phosphate oxidase
MMKIREISDRGLLFCTNYNSKKGVELDSNPRASVCFFWDSMDRQAIVTGSVERISRAESEKIFSQVAYERQITSIVSDQGQPICEKQALFDQYYKVSKELEQAKEVKAPESWYVSI